MPEDAKLTPPTSALRSALTPLPEDLDRAEEVGDDYYEPGGVSCSKWNFRLPRRRLHDQIDHGLDGEWLVTLSW